MAPLAATGFEPAVGAAGVDSTRSAGSGSLGSRMSLRLDLRLSYVPATAGDGPFGRFERMLAPTNAPRGS